MRLEHRFSQKLHFILKEEGNESWNPNLQNNDNPYCQKYVTQAKSAVEVEASLWQQQKTTKPLNFTVKVEDFGPLRNWSRANPKVPLFVVQVFYDRAYALPFSVLEEVITLPKENKRHVAVTNDRTIKKQIYMISLQEGNLLGDIPEPDVEGEVFKSPKGKVTVYGRLCGSAIEPSDFSVLESLAMGTLHPKRAEH
jgi:hypothetical protein